MADTKISSLAEDTTPAAGDFLVSVDVSDTSMAPTGTDKKVQIGNLGGALGLGSAATHAASDFLTPTGSGAALAGITAAQVGLGNVANAAQLVAANNLSDLASAAAARANLGLVASATTDTTNASNITSGTLPSARLAPFVASGASHAQGAVPDPGATVGTTRYLREDATWAPPPAASVAVGSTITGATAGSLIFAGAGGVVAQDNADLFYDSANHRLGIGTKAPAEALDVAGGRIRGGTYSATHPVALDLSSNVAAGFATFYYPNNGKFVAAEANVLGTNDIFFQAFPVNTGGYGYLEAWNAAGLAVGTGNSSPVLIRPNRSTTAEFHDGGDCLLGVGSTATAATQGWPYLTACAGAPTGTPAGHAGFVPLVYDTVNNKLWIYNGGWKSAAFA